VKLLLACPTVQVDLKDRYENTPLLYAAFNGHEDVGEAAFGMP